VLSKRIDDNQSELNRKIGLIEKEQTAKDYLVKTAVGLGIFILIKFVFDYLAYDNGFKKGIELKQKEVTLDSTINQRLIERKQLMQEEKNLIFEIDSLKKVQLNLKSPTTQSKHANK